MFNHLAVVAGLGALSREIDDLATALPGGYTRYTITPWGFSQQEPIRRIVEAIRQSNRAIGLNPFRFSEIAAEFAEKNIKHIFLTGDFPADRFWQSWIGDALPKLYNFADQACKEYFDATPPSFSRPVRYFVALARLIEELQIEPLLASQVFPSLNLSAGYVSNRPPPQSVLDRMPDITMAALQAIREARHPRNRLSQAVIIDRNIVCEVEGKGTDEMLRRYGRVKNRAMPFLLKLPSAEFNPALDQPTIGPNTVTLCKKVGIQGIVVCAETTVVVEKTATIDRANALDIFLCALPFKQLREAYLQHSPSSWAQTAPTDLQPL